MRLKNESFLSVYLREILKIAERCISEQDKKWSGSLRKLPTYDKSVPPVSKFKDN